MRFIHIADVHIGAVPERDGTLGIIRKDEIIKSFQNIIDICNIEMIDLLLIAGDLFHKQPTLAELKEINYILGKLTMTKVVLIAGNHDYIGTGSKYREFRWVDHVTMLVSDEMDSIYLEEINTEVYGFSYHTRNIIEDKYKCAEPTVSERMNILLAHGGDQRNIPMDKKRLLASGFDYVALGHIHKAEIIDTKMAYAGSLEALDKNELGDHGYIKGEIKKYQLEGSDTYKSDVDIQFIKSGLRSYKEIKIEIKPEMTFTEIIENIHNTIVCLGEEDMYKVFLEGVRDSDLCIDHEKIQTMDSVVEVSDSTVPDYDFDHLLSENQSNIIGMYIERIKGRTENQELAEKSLYYGIMALLNHKA